jgi:hypothetical protein
MHTVGSRKELRLQVPVEIEVDSLIEGCRRKIAALSDAAELKALEEKMLFLLQGAQAAYKRIQNCSYQIKLVQSQIDVLESTTGLCNLL